MSDEYGATHLLAFSGDKRTLCGLKSDITYPHMLARFVTRHREGHARVGKDFTLCAECEAQAIERGIAFEEQRASDE